MTAFKTQPFDDNKESKDHQRKFDGASIRNGTKTTATGHPFGDKDNRNIESKISSNEVTHRPQDLSSQYEM